MVEHVHILNVKNEDICHSLTRDSLELVQLGMCVAVTSEVRGSSETKEDLSRILFRYFLLPSEFFIQESKNVLMEAPICC